MSKNKRIISFVVFGIGLLFFFSFYIGKDKIIFKPKPGEEIVSDSEKESQEQQERIKWIEQMHRTSPGVNWRIIEQQTRWQKYQTRKNQSVSRQMQSFNDTIGNGALIGNWMEKGSANQSGRIVVAEYDSANNLIYCGSAGGTIWRGNINGTNWVPLNDALKFDGILMIRIIPGIAASRILVATKHHPFFYYSDDAGSTWNSSLGLSYIAGFGSVVRPVVMNDSLHTIFLLAEDWDSLNWDSQTTLYRSTDLGNSFAAVYSFPVAVNGPIRGFDLWTSRYGNVSAYLINQNGTQVKLYELNQSNGNPQLLNQFSFTSGDRILLTGYNSSPLILYAYSDRRIYCSLDGGMSWALRGTVTQDYFSRNSFSCSYTNNNSLFFGGQEAFRSYNGGASWTRVNTWGSYYNDPVFKLHADIPCILPFLNSGEKQFIGTDGGLYISDDSLLTVQNLSMHGLNASQYYSTYTNRTDSNYIFAGTQDQGIQRCQTDSGGVVGFEQIISGDYGHLVSADGGSSIWMVYPSFVAYVDNAPTNTNWFTATWDFNGATQLWMPPLMADPLGASNVCYLAGKYINTSGSHIIKLEQVSNTINTTELAFDFFAASSGGYVSAIAASSLNTQDWYALTDNGYFFHSNNGGINWNSSLSFTAPSSHYFYGSAIYVSKINPGLVFIGGSGYNNPPAYTSTNFGQTFTSCSNGLPPTLIFALTADENENFIFAATEAGPYVYVVSQGIWYDMSAGNAPDQVYWSVDYIPLTKTVRFGTYGRGIWDFKISTNISAGITEVKSKSELEVFPNPSTGMIRINENNFENAEIKIYNSAGSLVYYSPKMIFTIDISGKPNGIYFMEVVEKGNSYCKKILLQ